MTDFLKRLTGDAPLVLDGAMGSELIARGLVTGDSPERWNIDHPEVIQSIHRAYFDAGADIIQTNTFGGNRLRLNDTHCPYDVTEVCDAAVRIARSTRPSGRLVAGNIGPVGVAFPPLGNARKEDLAELFAEQASALAEAGVDLLNVETMTDAREARAALTGARAACDLPVAVSLSFRETRRGFFTIMGDPAVESLRELLAAGADAVGANCTLSSEPMARLAAELRGGIDGALVVQANAGEPKIGAGGDTTSISYPEGPEEYAERMGAALSGGIEIVGGCCGTTPAHVAALVRRRDELSR